MKKLVLSPILLYAVIALMAVLLIRSCHNNEVEEDRYHDNLEIQQQEIEIGKTKLGQITAEKNALVVSNKELRDELWVKDDSLQDLVKKFRKVKAAFVINTEVNLEPMTIPAAPVDELGLRSFKRSTPYYKLSGAVLPNYDVRLDSLSMFNTQRLVLGVHKGFFNRTLTAEITNSNPYIQTTDLTTQVLSERVRRFGVGPFFGYDFFNGNFAGGVSLNYNLIMF